MKHNVLTSMLLAACLTVASDALPQDETSQILSVPPSVDYVPFEIELDPSDQSHPWSAAFTV